MKHQYEIVRDAVAEVGNWLLADIQSLSLQALGQRRIQFKALDIPALVAEEKKQQTFPTTDLKKALSFVMCRGIELDFAKDLELEFQPAVPRVSIRVV